MSLLKWKADKNNWFTFYVDAIKNRLRRDLNLSDLQDIQAARDHLELCGENNHTHYHDDRYVPQMENLEFRIKALENKLTVGSAPAEPQQYDIWFDSNQMLIKQYLNGKWQVYGAIALKRK